MKGAPNRKGAIPCAIVSRQTIVLRPGLGVEGARLLSNIGLRVWDAVSFCGIQA